MMREDYSSERYILLMVVLIFRKTDIINIETAIK